MKLRTVLMLTVAGVSVTGAWAAHHKTHTQDLAVTLKQVDAKILPMSLKSIDVAQKALELGDHAQVAKELSHLKAMLIQIQSAVAKEIGPALANVKCPIMGAPIRPDRVTPDLVRQYQGQKLAFCCAGCPEMWDKLTDTNKQAKLKASLPTDSDKPHGHPH